MTHGVSVTNSIMNLSSYPSLTFSARKVMYITSSSGSNELFVANHRVGKSGLFMVTVSAKRTN